MSMFNWLRFAIRMQFVLKMQSHHNISASLPRLDCPITPPAPSGFIIWSIPPALCCVRKQRKDH